MQSQRLLLSVSPSTALPVAMPARLYSVLQTRSGATAQARSIAASQLHRAHCSIRNGRKGLSLQARASGASFSGNTDGRSESESFQSDQSSNQSSVAPEKNDSQPQSMKIAVYIFLWYGANILFNRQNKMLLNVFPCPWFIATMQLVGSFVFGVFIWTTGIQPKPHISPNFLKSLWPVAMFHTLGHVTACIAFGAMAVSFAHIVKSAEPVFSVLLSAPLLGVSYPSLSVWASLVPIIAGCAISSLNEVTFAWAGFLNASASNVGMVLRNIASKKMMGQYNSMGGINLFVLISSSAVFFCAPMALYFERQKWGMALDAAKASVGNQQVMWLMFTSALLYTLYNVFSYLVLDLGFSPTTLSVGNSMKRVAVVLSSVIIFQNPVSPLNWFGSALAILGTYLYSLAAAKSK